MKQILSLLTVAALSVQLNAQLASINEDFNDFTPGNNTFPQNGWSAVISANPLPFPPAPMMLVVANETNTQVQSYAGNNGSDPSYLITPQIVNPAGNTSIKFKSGLVAPSPGVSTVQIGLVAEPSDMSTFTAVGDAINITTTTIDTYTVAIPASEYGYLVFKITPTATHTATAIDDVVYDLTENLSISDAFNNQTDVKLAVSSDNSSLHFSGKSVVSNVTVYSTTGQKVLANKVLNGRVNISNLQSGVYFVVSETKEGQSIKSKFIKK